MPMNRRVLPFLLLCVLLMGALFASVARAHGGEDHAEAAPAAVGAYAVTTSVLTRRYEVVLKHAPVRGGQPYRGTLYLASFETNLPVRGAEIAVAEPGVTDRPFVVHETATPGVYTVERAAGFARDGRVSLTVQVASPAGSDLALLSEVYIGPVDTPGDAGADGTAGSASGLPWGWMAGVLALGGAFAYWLVRSARQRRTAASDTDAAPSFPRDELAGDEPTRAAKPVVRQPSVPQP